MPKEISGVASADQHSPASFEYAQARQWMTGDVLAAIQGARGAGVGEITAGLWQWSKPAKEAQGR